MVHPLAGGEDAGRPAVEPAALDRTPARPARSCCAAWIAGAELANFDHGGDRSKAPNGALKITEAAQALNVGERTVERAIEVKDSATPKVVAAVKSGNTPACGRNRSHPAMLPHEGPTGQGGKPHK